MNILFNEKRISLPKQQKDVKPLKIRTLEKFNKIMKPA